MEVLRSQDENSPTLFAKYHVIYSDGKEEVKITYKRLKEDANE